MNNQAIQEHLQADSITEIRELTHVLLVRYIKNKKKCCSFVSKKINAKPSCLFQWALHAKTRRQQQSSKWVAKIIGKNEKYTFNRNFLSPVSREWGRHGATETVFDINSIGYYHDSEGNYFQVYLNVETKEYDARYCSYQEVKSCFYGI